MKRRSSLGSTVPDVSTAGDVTASYSGVVVTELADYEEYDSTASTAAGGFGEGKSWASPVASLCRQVAAGVHDVFCNIYLIKNQRIGDNSATIQNGTL